MLAFPFPCFLSVCDQTVRSGLNPMKSQDKINLPSLRLLLFRDLVMEMRSKPCTVHRDVSGRCWAWAWSRLEDHGVQEGKPLGKGREGMSRNKSTVQSYCLFCPHHKTCQSLPCLQMPQEQISYHGYYNSCQSQQKTLKEAAETVPSGHRKPHLSTGTI